MDGRADERGQRVEAIAEEALGLFGAGRQAAPFASRYPGFDVSEAYAVASRVRDMRAARGDRAIGRKIGFTNPTVQGIYGVSGPIWNFMFDSTVRDLASAAGQFAVAGLPEPKIEPEIALHLASAPRADMDDDALFGCVDRVAHGFEIVQSIFPGWRFSAADAVAGYGLHGAYFLGPWHEVSGDRRAWARALPDFAIELRSDSGVILEGRGANVLGGPLAALRHLVRELDASGATDSLAAGEIVTTGTLTDAPAVAAGQTWTTSLRGIPLAGLRLELG
jgi:2-oxo-3-hexenedioate decarboxylase